jgi:hypothetical protein
MSDITEIPDDGSLHRLRTWRFAQAAIDYICGRLGVDRRQACAVLKDALEDGQIRARGPMSGADASEIPSTFWRFAAIDPDGTAVNLSSLQKLAWFEVNLDDVLLLWPLAESSSDPAETPPAQPARKAVPKRELELFVVEGKFESCDKAEKAARNHFVGRSVNRDVVRGIWRGRGLSGNVGRPRGGVS